MSYFRHTTTKVTVQALETCVPVICITPKALTKMQLFIDNCSEEVGWLGTAHKEGKVITIDDMYLFEQEVHSTTTEITPDGLGKFGEAVLQQENGMDIWNNLKVWGHSHVRMAVSPSGQDNKQMETFAEGGHDWFIRIIGNKNGDMKLDLYEYSLGIIINDVPWIELRTAEEDLVAKRIAELQALLNNMSKHQVAQFEEGIKEEIKEKVKKKTYGYTKQGYNQEWSWKKEQGYTTTNNTTKDTTDTGKDTNKGNKKKEEEKKVIKLTRDKEDDTFVFEYKTLDIIDTDLDVYSYLSQNELLDVAECATHREVEEVLESLGFDDYFSYNDVLSIKAVAKDLAKMIYCD